MKFIAYMVFFVYHFLSYSFRSVFYHCTGLGNETGKFQNINKFDTWIFICLFVINEKLMNSTFVLCQFEILCFEINALMMASVSTHAFLKSGPETVHDLSQYIHRNCSHFILNSLF